MTRLTLKGLREDLGNLVDFGTKAEWNKVSEIICRNDNCLPSSADIWTDKHIVNPIFNLLKRAYYSIVRLSYEVYLV